MRRTKPRRAYVDSSVFGGVYDEEFAVDSRQFFEQVKAGRFQLLTSELVRDELREAPRRVRDLFDSLLSLAELLAVDADTVALQAAYLDAGIVSPQWAGDALHVAVATVQGAEVIVSWNFRHIVHFDKAPRYNAVNRLQGWNEIAIHSPREVVEYEDEDEDV